MDLKLLPAEYTDVAPIGHGAFGSVWGARHPAYGEVAVKVLDPDYARDPEAAWRFHAEYRRLAGLALPGVPRARAAGLTEDGRPFLAMDRMPGHAPFGPLPATAVRRAVGAIADVLARLHATGLVHGDVKAGNVMVAPDGTAALLDLATAAPIGAPRVGLVGTPTHLAPEAWRGAPFAPEADWYALGVLAWQLWHGELPFRGDGAALLRAHTAEDATFFDGEEDPRLAAAIAALLAKDPAGRWAGVRSDAIGGDGRVVPAGLRAADVPVPEALLAPWRERLAAGGVLALAGPAGSGKTRVLEAWRAEAVAAGRAWLGVAAAAGQPWATARTLVRRALAASGVLPSPEIEAWLAGGLPPGWEELEPRARRTALAAASGESLAAAAALLGPLAVAVDDLEQADEASRGLLAAWQGDPRLAAVAWAQTGPGGLALEPWPAEQVAALAAARLGAPLPPGLGPLLAGFAWPGELERALAGWLRDGALRWDGAWAFAPVAVAPPTDAMLAAVMQAWPAGGLPLAALPFALGAGPPQAPAGVLAQGLLERLGALVDAGLVVVRGGIARPTDLAPVAPDPDLAAHLARAVEAADGPPAIAARLARAGSDRPLMSRLVRRAAEEALAALAIDEALDLLGDVPPDDLALAYLRGEAARCADRLDDAHAAYSRAIPLAAEHPVLAARSLIGRAKCAQLRGDYPAAASDLAAAEAAATPLDRLVAARAAIVAARVAYFQGDTAAALAACERAKDLARRVAIAQGEAGAVAVVLAAILNLHGALLAETDPSRASDARYMLEEALQLAERAGDRLGHAAALESLGNVHLAAGDLPAARDAFAAHEAACAAAQAPTERLSGAMNRAIALAALGDPAAGPLAASVAAEGTARRRPFVAALARGAEGEAAWRAGDWARAWPAFDEGLALAEGAGNRYAQLLVRLGRVDAAGAFGDPARLAAELADLEPLVGTDAAAEARARLALGRGRAALLAGDAAAAERIAAAYAWDPNQAVALRACLLSGDAIREVGSAADAALRYRRAEAIASTWSARWHQEAAWLGLAQARAAGDWLGQILGTPGSGGNLQARVAAAELRDRAGQPVGPAGEAARRAWAAAVAALPPADAARLGGAPPAAPPPPAGAGLDPALIAPWLAAIALAATEEALHDALLGAVLDLGAFTRGYVLSYADGQLADVATSKIDYAAEAAEGFSTTIADEALITGQPVYVVDAAGSARFRAAASVVALGLRSVAAIPFASATTIYGVVYADRAELDPVLGPGDLALLALVATAAAERAGAMRAEARVAGAWAWFTTAGDAARALAALPPAERRAAALDRLVALAGARGGRWERAGETRATAGDLTLDEWSTLLQPPVPGRPDEQVTLVGLGADAGEPAVAWLGAIAPWLDA